MIKTVEIIEIRYLESSRVSGGIFFPRIKSFPLNFWKNGREWNYSIEETRTRAKKWLKKRNLTGSIYLLTFDREDGKYIKIQHLGDYFYNKEKKNENNEPKEI